MTYAISTCSAFTVYHLGTGDQTMFSTVVRQKFNYTFDKVISLIDPKLCEIDYNILLKSNGDELLTSILHEKLNWSLKSMKDLNMNKLYISNLENKLSKKVPKKMGSKSQKTVAEILYIQKRACEILSAHLMWEELNRPIKEQYPFHFEDEDGGDGGTIKTNRTKKSVLK